MEEVTITMYITSSNRVLVARRNRVRVEAASAVVFTSSTVSTSLPMARNWFSVESRRGRSVSRTSRTACLISLDASTTDAFTFNIASSAKSMSAFAFSETVKVSFITLRNITIYDKRV